MGFFVQNSRPWNGFFMVDKARFWLLTDDRKLLHNVPEIGILEDNRHNIVSTLNNCLLVRGVPYNVSQ